ncbi:MAG TPA: ABC transporter substrate binding protein [Gammaproteobacteria bacterium]|jgi:putative ABC transport system substrate-binding protein|nr:ABC transporter substrate binding protein [Gammaproteobacteria bacterium]
MRLIVKWIALCWASWFLIGCSQSNEKKIGIIVPIEHQSLNDIVTGFTTTLHELSPVPVQIKVMNAHGDLNVQRAIIQQMKGQYDIIVPIGMAATQMTLSLIKQQPIISLASLYTEQDRKSQQPCHIAVVHDEISPVQIVNFIHQAYPGITQMSLLHSPAEKIFPQVEVAIEAGKKLGITIKPVMITALSELHTAANALPENIQAILVLKDYLIASGINTLAITAEKRHIPVIAADQGSVQEGASFALGVNEREIGVEGAKLAVAILRGESACSLPIVDMTQLTVFINPISLTKEQQRIESIDAAAKRLQYQVEVLQVKK